MKSFVPKVLAVGSRLHASRQLITYDSAIGLGYPASSIVDDKAFVSLRKGE